MDSTPGLEVFESYETDYKSLSASISDLLKEARDSKGGEGLDTTFTGYMLSDCPNAFVVSAEAKRAVLRRAEHHLEEGDEIVSRYGVALQSAS